MQLIGYLDSSFVRRVAISADLMGIPFEHRELSIFRDFDSLRAINPRVGVPAASYPQLSAFTARAEGLESITKYSF